MKSEPITTEVKPIDFPGVNGCAICECGSMSFRVGMFADTIGNNVIRCLQCERCGHKLAVPFFHVASPTFKRWAIDHGLG